MTAIGNANGDGDRDDELGVSMDVADDDLRMTGTRHSVLAEVFDDILAHFGGDDYADEIAEARRQFDERRGRVFEDEELWEPWTQAFLEWYVTEWPLSRDGDGDGAKLPAAAHVAREAESMGQRRRAAAAWAWHRSHRSIFEVRALKAGRVELLDLYGGAEFSVLEERTMVGVSAGDVGEMRVIGFEEEVLFARTFCFHPVDARKAIIARIKDLRDANVGRYEILDTMASLRVRCERYRHVSPTRIYQADPTTLGQGKLGPR